MSTAGVYIGGFQVGESDSDSDSDLFNCLGLFSFRGGGLKLLFDTGTLVGFGLGGGSV